MPTFQHDIENHLITFTEYPELKISACQPGPAPKFYTGFRIGTVAGIVCQYPDRGNGGHYCFFTNTDCKTRTELQLAVGKHYDINIARKELFLYIWTFSGVQATLEVTEKLCREMKWL